MVGEEVVCIPAIIRGLSEQNTDERLEYQQGLGIDGDTVLRPRELIEAFFAMIHKEAGFYIGCDAYIPAVGGRDYLCRYQYNKSACFEDQGKGYYGKCTKYS